MINNWFTLTNNDCFQHSSVSAASSIPALLRVNASTIIGTTFYRYWPDGRPVKELCDLQKWENMSATALFPCRSIPFTETQRSRSKQKENFRRSVFWSPLRRDAASSLVGGSYKDKSAAITAGAPSFLIQQYRTRIALPILPYLVANYSPITLGILIPL